MIRRVRICSGLVMLVYVAMHLLNHAVGLVSLDAMERALRLVADIWVTRPAQVMLYGSFVVHYVLALWALWQRRSLRLRPAELGQLALGFAIPFLLVRHVVMTRVSNDFFHTSVGHEDYLLWVYFVRSPEQLLLQLPVLVVAWAHAMIGLHFWLKVRPWYERLRGPALVVAVLVPILSLLGTIEAGRLVQQLAATPGWAGGAFSHYRLPTPEAEAALDDIADWLTWGFVAAILAVLAARGVRRGWQRRHATVRIGYPDGRFVEVMRGTSVLEASRLAGIPHASVCGGRGRCSTCRVRVRAEAPGLPPPGEDEARVLHRIGATHNIRLACMLRPIVPVEVTPLLPPFAHAADAGRRVDFSQGSEREIAILFADIRGFTALSEGRLPYDVVFVLNRYFATMGRAVESAGGHVDKFIGDGVMALFGISSGPQAGCREALAAARMMSQRLAELNASLKAELPQPLRIGIGIHAGPAIVGEMGYGKAVSVTAIGDAVNTASRLETLTKAYECELVVSEEVVIRAGFSRAAFHWHEVEIRGRQQTMAAAVLESAAELPDPPAAGAAPAAADAAVPA
ncbi:MAG: 2Fe-2S iron-sulfur cluster binding domain-containing protein [Alphaproteobacteria bacterium]|nr:2Fe-2S iron-sulfur cluster binding domain-containing protein [Alphaproteobacteria bacterium]